MDRIWVVYGERGWDGDRCQPKRCSNVVRKCPEVLIYRQVRARYHEQRGDGGGAHKPIYIIDAPVNLKVQRSSKLTRGHTKNEDSYQHPFANVWPSWYLLLLRLQFLLYEQRREALSYRQNLILLTAAESPRARLVGLAIYICSHT